ncbi:MAG: alpha/beta hydrolase domain-containing protein [Muricoprocola sp.]
MEIDRSVYKWYEEMNVASFVGPVPVEDDSVPFGTMMHSRVPMDLIQYGYTEQEYFVTGNAAVYDRKSGKLEMICEPKPYCNRIIVRRPIKKKDFSGRVYVDILNATNNFDFEDLWQRIYSWCVKNGHTYVGITSKPVNVKALRLFDEKRYHILEWPSLEKDGAEEIQEGAFWDILTQTTEALRYGESSPLKDLDIKWLYLSGQSQSGAYLNTYLANFYSLVKNKHIYDGFINLVGVQFSRAIGQDTLPLHFSYREEIKTDVPYLGITCEGDYELFKGFQAGNLKSHIPDNSNTEDNKCRYYEIGGAPHYDIECPVIICDRDIRKAGGNPPELNLDKGQELNRFPLRAYILALIEKLHCWVVDGGVPECADLFLKDEDGKLIYDEYGNVCGGFRTPFLDVPVAKYTASGKKEGTEAIGTCEWMSKEEFIKKYRSVQNYLNEFKKSVFEQIQKGWLLESDAVEIMEQMKLGVEERYLSKSK